jgi:L-fuculose-phosphate aldolase
MDAPLLAELRARVAEAGVGLLDAGLVRGTAGNVSARSRDRRLVAISPTGIGYRRITPDLVPVLDLDGQVVDGTARPSSELPMHLAVYRARPDVGAVVHTHSVFAATFAALGEELPGVHYAIAWAGRRVRVAPYATYGSRELAERCLATLGADQAVLLANHGVLAVGPDLDRAVAVAEAVEFTAEVCWRARCVGTPNVLPDEELERVARAFARYGQQAPPGGQ